ncbi:PREDICTED: uncharacterized protein LOC104729012 [Camelina sativa]|uniref:RBR-type E3 ubiquitin transferase n=1 Tax=Camelina sativa TaxID=90675 RepID=A0ABM1QMC3_CAMSA|nr:PREDICTED: uncharacterized protein LOC104729012 [Camelina sativa]
MGDFLSSQPVLVAGNDVKFAYKLARESILAKVTPHEDPRQAKATRKEECAICFNDIYAERMFSVDKCRHRFCFQCVKQHVEVKLLHGLVPKCPHGGCKTELVIDACGKLLTPKLSQMWQQRIKEIAVPVTERVYCPYPRCSALMSKTKIAETAKSLLSVYPKSGVRRCVECRGLFCVDCKVPWHGNLSCTEYKKLYPNPPADDVKLKSLANNKMWRQCGKCQHMIELTQGCNHITCRCGHEFCYNCGGGWNKKTETCVKRCPTWDEAYIITRQDPVRANVAPNNYFDDVITRQDPVRANLAPNNYFDDDDEDEDDDDEDDYDYDDFLLHFGHAMNDPKPDEPFDPFFDLPDGVIFTPDMLSPKSRRQLYQSDDDDSDDNAPANEFGEYYTRNDLEAQSANAMNDPKPEEPFDPFFDLPDGVIFNPDMLSPKSRRQLYQTDDDDSDDNAPANEFGEYYTRNDLEAQSANAMNDPKPEEPFDPFFDLPDGVIFNPDMLSPKSRRQLYQTDDDDADDNAPANEFGEYYTRNNLEALCANADEDDEYFGKYGRYTGGLHEPFPS